MKTILSLILIMCIGLSSCDNSPIGCGEFRVADTTAMEGKPIVVYKYCDSSEFTVKVRLMVRPMDDSMPSKVMIERLETNDIWTLKPGDRILVDSFEEVSSHYQVIKGYKKYIEFKGPNKEFGAAIFLPVNEY